VFWVELGELEESINVIGVSDDLVLALQRVVLLGCLELYGIVCAFHLEFLADLEELSDSWR
jgi:hypothetical protein